MTTTSFIHQRTSKSLWWNSNGYKEINIRESSIVFTLFFLFFLGWLFAFVFSLGCVYLCSLLHCTFDRWVPIPAFYIQGFSSSIVGSLLWLSHRWTPNWVDVEFHLGSLWCKGQILEVGRKDNRHMVTH